MADGKSCTAVRIYLVPQNCTVKCDQDAAAVHSVVSDSSAAPWTVALQAPLSMEFFQARLLEWIAISSSRGSSQHRERTHISFIVRWILYQEAFTNDFLILNSEY